MPRVAVGAAQAAVAPAPLRAERVVVVVGQPHAGAVVEVRRRAVVAVVVAATAALSAAPALEPHWSGTRFALSSRCQAADRR